MKAINVLEKFGHSDCMGPELRRYVEHQLLADINWYLTPGALFNSDDFCFDWSESCVEGHRTHWLDGEVENFSGIRIVNSFQNLVAEGWMEFIETEDGLEVFWWFLRSGNDYAIQTKDSNHVPNHIWDRLSDSVRSKWSRYDPNCSSSK